MRVHGLRKYLVALLGCMSMLMATADATTTIGQRIAVPAYFLPDSLWNHQYWAQMNGSTPAVALAVANVLNGPDYQASSAYAATIQAAHNAGIKVLGYVDSGYFGTSTPAKKTRLNQTSIEAWRSQIQHDVNAWYQFYGAYGLDGIFFDQGQNSCGTGNEYANLYKSLSDYVKHNHPGAMTVINPGVAVPQCYQDSADILLTFEGTYQCYIQDASCPAALRYQSPGWNPLDPKKFWHLVYQTTELQVPDAITKSKERSAGYLYITPDGADGNPWDSLPDGNYWATEQVQSGPGGTADTTAPSVPTSLDTVDEWYTWASLDWVKSTDAGSGVVAYDLFQGANQIWSVPATSAMYQAYTVNGLQPTTAYTFTVKARDGAGNVSASSAPLTFSTEPADGSPPTAPGTPAVSQVTYTSALLTWSASSDADDVVAAYDVYRAGTKIMTLGAGTTSATVIGLAPGSTTSFTVKARDSEGNQSAASGAASVTTTASGGLSIVNEGGTYGATDVTYSADFVLPFATRRVFIDSDNDPSTGYQTSGIGADHFIENELMYRYTGTPQYPWSWSQVRVVTPGTTGATTTWQILVSDLGANLAPTQKAVFQAEGFAPPAYSNVVSLIKN
jgi:chitodextrinase